MNVGIVARSSATYARNLTTMKPTAGTRRANISEMDNRVEGGKKAKDRGDEYDDERGGGNAG